MLDLVLQDPIDWQTDRIAGSLGFKKLVDLRIGKSCVTSEIQILHDAPVAGDYRLQHCAPSVGAVHVSRSQGASLDIAELVEYEQRVIAGATEVPIIGASFLLAIEPAPA